MSKRSFWIFLAAVLAIGAVAAYLFIPNYADITYLDVVKQAISDGTYLQLINSVESFLEIGFVATLALAGLLGIFGRKAVKFIMGLLVFVGLLCITLQLPASGIYINFALTQEIDFANAFNDSIFVTFACSFLSAAFLGISK